MWTGVCGYQNVLYVNAILELSTKDNHLHITIKTYLLERVVHYGILCRYGVDLELLVYVLPMTFVATLYIGGLESNIPTIFLVSQICYLYSHTSVIYTLAYLLFLLLLLQGLWYKSNHISVSWKRAHSAFYKCLWIPMHVFLMQPHSIVNYALTFLCSPSHICYFCPHITVTSVHIHLSILLSYICPFYSHTSVTSVVTNLSLLFSYICRFCCHSSVYFCSHISVTSVPIHLSHLILHICHIWSHTSVNSVLTHLSLLFSQICLFCSHTSATSFLTHLSFMFTHISHVCYHKSVTFVLSHLSHLVSHICHFCSDTSVTSVLTNLSLLFSQICHLCSHTSISHFCFHKSVTSVFTYLSLLLTYICHLF